MGFTISSSVCGFHSLFKASLVLMDLMLIIIHIIITICSQALTTKIAQIHVIFHPVADAILLTTGIDGQSFDMLQQVTGSLKPEMIWTNR